MSSTCDTDVTCEAAAIGAIPKTRREILQEIAQLRAACRQKGSLTGLLAIEYRQYRQLATTYGYDFVEQLSAQVIQRLTENLPRKDKIYYLGRNEFLIVLVGLRIPEQLTLAVEKVARLFRADFSIGPIHYRLSPRLGATIEGETSTNDTELWRQADIALLNAADANHPISYFHQDDEGNKTPTPALHRALEKAIRISEVRAVFQPKTDFRTGQLVGVESLIRWQSPEFGFVPPDVMIEVAESSDLIIELTLWTIKNAFQQYDRWSQRAVPIAVNLSPATLMEESLPRVIENLRAFWNVPQDAVSLEVTETAFMDDPEPALERLQLYHDMGFKLSIDDFGTGYSSLAYLKKMPVQELKIDKAFIQHMHEDEKDRGIVEAVANLAQNFGLKVVAEGVETAEIYHQAMALGCHTAQGYLISKPISASEFETWYDADAWYRPGR